MDKAGKENNDAKMTDSASQKIVTASLESSYLNVFISSYITYERSLSWLKKKLVTYSFFVSPNASQFIKSSEKSIQSICLIFFINQQRWIRPKKIKFNKYERKTLSLESAYYSLEIQECVLSGLEAAGVYKAWGF